MNSILNENPVVDPRLPRLLCVDQGEKVIGLALSDALWLTARPLAILHRTTKTADFAHILEHAARHNVGLIIIGSPDNPDQHDEPGDQPSARVISVRRWASRLAAATGIPVVLWEEQFSTNEADRLLAEAGARPKDYTTRIDDVAAAVILQVFIDALRSGIPLPNPVKMRPGYATIKDIATRLERVLRRES